MNITIEKPDLEKFITDQVNAGRFSSVEELVATAVARLQHEVNEGDFDPGELDALVAEGEADIQNGDVIDGEEALRSIHDWVAENRNATHK